MALAHVLGASGLNLSLYDFMGNDPDDEPQRAAFLRRWRPVCDRLADLFPVRSARAAWASRGSPTWPGATAPTVAARGVR